MASHGAYMWGGAAGTIFWVDPEEDIVALAMIQLMGSPWALRERISGLLPIRLSSNPTSSNDTFHNGLLMAVRAHGPVRQLISGFRSEPDEESSVQEDTTYPGHLE